MLIFNEFYPCVHTAVSLKTHFSIKKKTLMYFSENSETCVEEKCNSEVKRCLTLCGGYRTAVCDSDISRSVHAPLDIV